ncbi:alpha/beta fold hydrolase [Rhizobium sp. No.120]
MKNYSIKIRGANLNVVEESGDGTTLVFLHYWGGTSRTYLPVMRLLAGDFRSIAFDQRGWGRSSKEGDFSLSSYASDTLALMQGLGLKSYILVGHSMGGKVAQLIASEQPEGLLGLALLAPAPASALPVSEAQRQMMFDSYQSREGIEAALSILSRRQLDEELRKQVIEDTLSGTAEAKATWVHEGMVADISSSTRRISVPTTVIVGSDDIVETVGRLRQEVPKTIPQAIFDVLPGLGHLAPLEGPAEVSQAIRRFASSLVV